jgi:hypothetical protein
MLISKNRSYGSSFSEPLGIFAKGLSADVQIRVRIDDKLARLARGTEFLNEDTVLDLIGYLVLWRVLRRLPVPGQETGALPGTSQVPEKAWRFGLLPCVDGRPAGRFWGDDHGKWDLCSSGTVLPARAVWQGSIVSWGANEVDLHVTGDQANFVSVFPFVVGAYPELRNGFLRFDGSDRVRVSEFLNGLTKEV